MGGVGTPIKILAGTRCCVTDNAYVPAKYYFNAIF